MSYLDKSVYKEVIRKLSPAALKWRVVSFVEVTI